MSINSWRSSLVPVLLVNKGDTLGWDDRAEGDLEDMFTELGDKLGRASSVLALPAPLEARQHVQCLGKVLEGNMERQAIHIGDVAVENHQASSVDGDRGREEGDIREVDESGMHSNDIVRGDDGWR